MDKLDGYLSFKLVTWEKYPYLANLQILKYLLKSVQNFPAVSFWKPHSNGVFFFFLETFSVWAPLFDVISTFVGYLMSKPSLEKNSIGTI